MASSDCTLYSTPTGNDANDGSEARPFQTITRGAGSLGPGQTLCVKAGTYDESFYNSIPSGTGNGATWESAMPVTIRAFPGDERRVIIRPSSGPFVLYTGYYRVDMYIVIDGVVFDGSNVDYQVMKLDDRSHHIRIVNSEIRNTKNEGRVGVLTGDEADYLEFVNVDVHDTSAYGFYLGGNHNLIAGATIYNVGGYGIHAYAGACDRPDGCVSFNTIRDSRVFNVRRYLHSSGSWKDPVGIGIYSGPGNEVYNNVVVGTGSDANFWGIRVQYGASEARIHNNTLYDTDLGIYIGEPNAIVRNNIIHLSNTPVSDNGAGTIADHNLTGIDPQFVDPAVGDFHLMSGSPAIDAGTSQDAPVADFDGDPRPLGAGIDIGADEYRSDPPSGSFADVPASHWAFGDIEKLYQGGFVAGCELTPVRKYCPEGTLARAEGAVFVERGVHGGGYLPPQPPSTPFDDVPLLEWYAKWVKALWEEGFTAGCATSPLRFCPNQGHTRAEATVFFLRMLRGVDYQPPEPGELFYTDVARGTWYFKWVGAAHAAGLTASCEEPGQRQDQLFRPNDPLTRAEAACMMARAKGLSP